ncbi:YhdP family protein [Roseateles violae]|uniref:YhdP family protein n=1 Tax=Roseateles violae TaxID=3058042 RepID=A0ABT8DK40_9BURK|nr:YhdP family protein [Pelomonas sp. PFR6]MDN3918785.1 YhdP family protein [Pelomonas sp. PFR6]
MLATASAAAPFWLTRPARLIWRGARWLLGLLAIVWLLLLTAWLLLHWAILPHIDEWRPTLEREASQSLGVPVRLGQISVRSGGWIPALELREVRLLDRQGREALRLPRVAAALSVRSLLALELRFDQLLIDGPQLEIRRDAQGRLFVAGLSVDTAEERPEAGGRAEEWADWFFSQHEFVVLNGRVRWIDERRQAPPLELSDLNLVLRNGLRAHALRLDATPPPAWGQRFGLRGRFTQKLLKRPGDLAHWSGQLYADLPRADLRELRRHLDLPFELSEGDGALRSWIDIKEGGLVGATVDMGLRAVRLRVSPKADPLQLEQIEGRLQLQREPQKLSLRASQLGFVGAGPEGKGIVWPRSDWGVQLRMAAPPKGAKPASGLDAELAPLVGGELNAQRLDFALMAQIAERLPVGEVPRALLARLAPQGVLSELNARWDGPLEAPKNYRLKARLDGLRLSAAPAAAPYAIGRPGVVGASVLLEASERGGQAVIGIADGSLELPGLFEEPLLPLQRLSATLDWKIEPHKDQQPPQLEFRLGALKLVTADLQGEFDGVWRSGEGTAASGRGARFPGQLELNGRIERIDATRVQRYLPLQVGETARHYVKEAIRGGTARDVTFKLRGDLADFPFDAAPGRGQFRIATQARDIELAYVPPAPGQPLAWPVLEHIDAELIFERGSMTIRDGRARTLGYELTGIEGGIKDLIHKPVLLIDGAGRGPLAELLRFVRASPVDEWTGHAMGQATSTGQANLKLNLQLPLADIAQAGVKGSVQLLGNDLRIRPDVPLLANARAKVDFDRKGVTVSAGQARVLGGDATFEGGTQRDGSLRFTGQGVASAEGLRRAGELGFVPRLAQAASGQAAYRLQLGFNNGQTEFAVTSNLQGMAMDLPAPLRKEAEAALPLRVQTTALAPGRDELRVELGTTLLAQYQRDVAGDSTRVLRGALAVQDALPALPASGVLAQARLGNVNLDAWAATAQRLAGGAAAPTSGSPAGPANGPASGPGSGGDLLDGGYMPGQIGLRAQSLQLNGRPITKLVAGITRAGGAGWRFSVDAEQLSGFVELRTNRAGQLDNVYARLARLSLPKQEVESVSRLLDTGLDQAPSSVPALDIVVDDFELRGKRLGHLEVLARAGPTRDWRLDKLQLRHPDAVLNASGQWLNEPGSAQRRSLMDWKLEVADAGNLLEKLGQGRVLRGGKGQLSGQIGWLGSPMSPDYSTMSGELSVALDRGQFLHAEPGVGRLLGVLSLQSLPRRFLLDFRDVFAEGFAFDGVDGDVTIARGVASSKNLRMRGVQAAVLMEGSTDLASETQNLRVLIVPEISAGGAALAYAAVNPVIGLGTFLAQLLLSRPMEAANTREFHITGSWEDPKVERVDHKAALEAAKASADAASAAKE